MGCGYVQNIRATSWAVLVRIGQGSERALWRGCSILYREEGGYDGVSTCGCTVHGANAESNWD